MLRIVTDERAKEMCTILVPRIFFFFSFLFILFPLLSFSWGQFWKISRGRTRSYEREGARVPFFPFLLSFSLSSFPPVIESDRFPRPVGESFSSEPMPDEGIKLFFFSLLSPSLLKIFFDSARGGIAGALIKRGIFPLFPSHAVEIEVCFLG